MNNLNPYWGLYRRLIYVFEFPDKSAYIGLTFNLNKRKFSHFFDKKSQVYKHIEKTGLQPCFKQLTDFIDRNSASIKEGEFLDMYKQEGWNILNKNKTGGLGGTIIKWTKEKCVQEALKYKTKKEWGINSRGSYESARKNKWIDECAKHMITGRKARIWTFDKCKLEATKYTSRTEWAEKSGSSYYAAVRYKWIEQCGIPSIY